ncbi:unnamed protein product [Pleuronectes platessa]|uniref:Uncharacterized protein n=1 Tax=Pleuronectes platessa TaxID=8262 RepID=A0A9N7VU61_PLEPL|nr:unnamed protein product [Pleuronectes platessa]
MEKTGDRTADLEVGGRPTALHLSHNRPEYSVVLPAYACHMRPGIIVHQEEPRTYCTSVGSDHGFKDFIPIPSMDMPPQTITDPPPNRKCQLSSMVLGSDHRAHYRTSRPEATLMKSVSDCLGRDIHTSGLLEVIL